MNEQDAYKEKQQARLDEWTAEIEKLKAQARQADADVRMEIEQDLKKAEAMKSNIEDRLKNIRKSAGDAWSDVREGMDEAAESLTAALRSASSRFA